MDFNEQNQSLARLAKSVSWLESNWAFMVRAGKKNKKQITNIAEVETALQEEWGKISQSQVMALIESMPRRIEAVISSNGWPTKY